MDFVGLPLTVLVQGKAVGEDTMVIAEEPTRLFVGVEERELAWGGAKEH